MCPLVTTAWSKTKARKGKRQKLMTKCPQTVNYQWRLTLQDIPDYTYVTKHHHLSQNTNAVIAFAHEVRKS